GPRGGAGEGGRPPHPLRVGFGEVVVHGPRVDAAAGEGVEVAGKGGGEGLALAGAHLGDASLVEEHPADELDVEVTLAQGTARRRAGESEGLEEHVVEPRAGWPALLRRRRWPRGRLLAERRRVW